MRKIIFAFIFLFSVPIFAQISDLASLSTGGYLGFYPLYNKNEQLFGYLTLFVKGKESETANRFEYVYLDKNLNKVSNNDFLAENSVTTYSPYINSKGDIELSPRISTYYGSNSQIKKVIIPKDKVINIKTNTISKKEEICYENKKFVACDNDGQTIGEFNKEQKKERKENGFIYSSDVTILNDGTNLVYEYKTEKSLSFDNAFIKFDKDNNEVWRYEFNKDMKKKERQFINVLYFDNEFLYLTEFTDVKKNDTYKLLKIDLKNGVKVVDKQITGYSKSSLFSLRRLIDGDYITNKKEFDDKLILVGKIIDDQSYTESGFFRIIIDKKTNDVSFTNINFIDAKPLLPEIKKYGEVEKGYTLKIRDLYMMKDGSVGFLFEKFKIGYNFIQGQTPKSTDLVFFSTNKDLKVTEVKTFAKDKTIGYTNSDYLFSQYINEGNGVAFFYRDFQKDEDGDKNWNLYINTVKNGTYSQEKIKISSKENTIIPYLAKEGYILLREYNKKAEYNGIRLEKLNY